jgi:hypothetical protein
MMLGVSLPLACSFLPGFPLLVVNPPFAGIVAMLLMGLG